ncbi:MAG: methylated-DNA--[protein]-cysteine S-methyltransferase [Magnetospirillum sp.]|nr:methylated-DNA--[protein]-cysteine S-methyltransferase [Magnetospirillum sp.]
MPQTIRYATAAADIGCVLIAATDKGLCWIAIGDSDDELLAALCAQYPAAELRTADAEFARWFGSALAALEQPHVACNAPLALEGSAFQQQVWQALRNIPAGQTTSYSRLAAKLGEPQATRAVARACAANRLAVLVPCHRVVAADGSLAGYRWGLARKKTLLARERAA